MEVSCAVARHSCSLSLVSRSRRASSRRIAGRARTCQAKSPALPADWSFSDAQKEIAIEVSGFLGLPHSVTIWCATLDGALFLGARAPETKRWPAWTDEDPNVRLKIAGKLYEVRLTPLEDPATIERLQAAFAAKYEIPAPDPTAPPPPPNRYWSVGAR